jgi:hypothetical protein
MAQRGTAAHADRATLGSRRHPFGNDSFISSVGGMRLHRRAPGSGIPAGAATGVNRATGSGDGMPWCTTADVMTQGVG